MPTIRRAEMNDLEDVIKYRLAFLREAQSNGRELDPDVVESTRKYITEKLPSGELIVWFAEENEQIIGTSGLVFFHRPPTYHCKSGLHAYIMNMYTVPEWRGHGIASMLIQNIIDYAKTTPANLITLHATNMGKPVYQRLGFASTSDEMTFSL